MLQDITRVAAPVGREIPRIDFCSDVQFIVALTLATEWFGALAVMQALLDLILR